MLTSNFLFCGRLQKIEDASKQDIVLSIQQAINSRTCS